jgi:hypothetical protein
MANSIKISELTAMLFFQQPVASCGRLLIGASLRGLPTRAQVDNLPHIGKLT